MKNKIPSKKAFETFEKMFQTRIEVAKQLIELMFGDLELATLNANYKTWIKDVPLLNVNHYSPKMRKLVEAFNDSINVERVMLHLLNSALWQNDRKKVLKNNKEMKDER